MTNEDAIWILEMICEREARTQAERDAFAKAIKALQTNEKGENKCRKAYLKF